MARVPKPIDALMTGSGYPSPTPFQTSRGLSEGSFGGAQAQQLRNFGQSITEASQQASALIVQQQDIANRSAAQDANNTAAERFMSAWSEFSQLRGRAAVDAYPAFQKQLQDIRDSTLGTVENPVARELAEPGIMSRYLSVAEGAATHNGNETRAWRVTSAESSIQVAASEALLHRDQFDEVHAGIAAAVDAGVNEMAQQMGWDDVTVEAKRAAYMGSAYASVIGGLLTDDPLKAQALYEEVKDQLDPITATSIEQRLEAPVRQARADGAVASIVGGGTTQTEGGGQAHSAFSDYGWSDAAIAGMIGGLQAESTPNLNPVIENYKGSGNFGIAQWGAARMGPQDGSKYGTLYWFAKENGLDYRQRSTQLAFVDWELNNTEKAAGDMLRAATTPYEAARAMLAYERPEGYTTAGNPETAHDWETRLRNTERLWGQTPPTLSDDQLMAAAYNSTDDPETRRATLTAMSQYITANNAAMGVVRSAMDQRIKDLGATLVTANGWQQTIPEAEIRAAYPTVEAEQYIQGLKVAQIVGQMDASIEFADPTKVQAVRDDLDSGTGPWSDAVREALNIGVMPTEAETSRLLRARDNVLTDFEANVAAHDNDPARKAARDAIAGQYDDLKATLATSAGWQQDITGIEEQIRAEYPEATANELIGNLRTMKIVGQINSQTSLVDLDAQRAVKADLENGNGPWSEAIRQAYGIGDNPTAAEKAQLARARKDALDTFNELLTGRSRDPDRQAEVAATAATVENLLHTLTTPSGYDNLPPDVLIDVKAVYPEAQANDIIGSLKEASIVGELNFSLPLIGRDGIPEVRTDLRTGEGPWSDRIREAYGIGDNPTSAETAKFDAARGRVLNGFDQVITASAEAQQRVRTAYDAAVRVRDQAIKDDSAAYAIGTPSVRAAYDTMVQNPTPDSWRAYATAVMSVQGQLGVAPQDRHLLTDAMRTAVIGHISQQDPRGAADYLARLEAETGSMWPQVFGELSTGADALPSELRVLGLISDPQSRATYVDILRAEKEQPGSTRKAVGEAASQLDESINDAMLDFNRTFSYGAGGTAVAANVTEATRLLAYRYAPTLGPDLAVEKAAAAVAGKYDVRVSEDQYVGRTPAGLGDTMVAASTYVRNSLLPQDLMAPADASGLYTPEELQRIALVDAQRATWVTSPRDDGWVLWNDNDQGGGGSYILDKRGQPIFLSFRDAPAYADRFNATEGEGIVPYVPLAPGQEAPAEQPAAPEASPIEPGQFEPSITVQPAPGPGTQSENTDVLEGAPVDAPKPSLVEEWLRGNGVQ